MQEIATEETVSVRISVSSMTSPKHDLCWAVLSIHGIRTGTTMDIVYRTLEKLQGDTKLTSLFVSLSCRVSMADLKQTLSTLECLGLVLTWFSGTEQYAKASDDSKTKALQMARRVIVAMDDMVKGVAGSSSDETFPLRLTKAAKTNPSAWAILLRNFGIRGDGRDGDAYHAIITRVRHVRMAFAVLYGWERTEVRPEPLFKTTETSPECATPRETVPDDDLRRSPVGGTDDFLWMDTND